MQTVWQVDDSPRYAGLGRWTKDNGVTEWTSNETYRPLPRREHTIRNDYDVIIGTNRHALTATGWVHEQDNIKFDSKTILRWHANWVNQYLGLFYFWHAICF
nr:DUF6607 family protein [Acinetobacter sp. UBA2063]